MEAHTSGQRIVSSRVIDVISERHADVSWTLFDRQGAQGTFAKVEGLNLFEDLLNRDDLDLSDCERQRRFFDSIGSEQRIARL